MLSSQIQSMKLVGTVHKLLQQPDPPTSYKKKCLRQLPCSSSETWVSTAKTPIFHSAPHSSPIKEMLTILPDPGYAGTAQYAMTLPQKPLTRRNEDCSQLQRLLQTFMPMNT